MSGNTLGKQRVELVFNDLNDTDRHNIAAGVAKLAPSSPLYANKSIEASVASLAVLDTALAQSNAAVEHDRKQLKADTDVETVARTGFDAELSTLATLVGNTSKTPADVSSMSFKPFQRAPRQKGPPPVPDGMDVILPRRGRGKAKVAVQTPAGVQWHFVIMASPNPPTATSWELLVGNGKTRELSGASGTQLWVKAARVVRGLQSDFCTAVLVTIP
jgi:hypothetical protein